MVRGAYWAYTMKCTAIYQTYQIRFYFRRLTTTVTQEEFLQCFEQYGTVVNCVILYYRFTSRSRGFGFITFEDPHICQQLLQMKRIPMRSDKFVEIKEAQPREASTQPNLTHTTHIKSRRGRNMGTMMPTAPFVPEMNHVMIGEPSMMNSSYTMGMTYGTVSEMPSPSMTVTSAVGFVPTVAIDTVLGPQHFYSSDYGYTTPFETDNATIVLHERETNDVFLQPHESYDPYYRMYHSYTTSTMFHGNSDANLPYSHSPQLYTIPMPYYLSQCVPYASEMTNRFDIRNDPYDQSGTIDHFISYRPLYHQRSNSIFSMIQNKNILSPTNISFYENYDASRSPRQRSNISKNK